MESGAGKRASPQTRAARNPRTRSAFRVQGSVELGGMGSQPAPPGNVVGHPARDQCPEARAVAEYAEVRQLVHGDGLEDRRRGKDEPPREREAARP